MVKGVKFNPDSSDISDVIAQKRGNVSAVARHYGVMRETIYDYLERNPKINKILINERDYDIPEQLDDSSQAISYFLKNIKTYPKLAFDSAKLVLDKYGHTRGWGSAPNQEKKTLDALDEMAQRGQLTQQ